MSKLSPLRRGRRVADAASKAMDEPGAAPGGAAEPLDKPPDTAHQSGAHPAAGARMIVCVASQSPSGRIGRRATLHSCRMRPDERTLHGTVAISRETTAHTPNGRQLPSQSAEFGRVRVCACVVCTFARVRMCGVRVCVCAYGCLAICVY